MLFRPASSSLPAVDVETLITPEETTVNVCSQNREKHSNIIIIIEKRFHVVGSLPRDDRRAGDDGI